MIIPSGSTIEQSFPLCKYLNISIYSNLTISPNELNVSNCVLKVEEPKYRLYSCNCYDGFVSKITINPFSINSYTIIYSYVYENEIPKTEVKHVSQSIYIDQRKINQTIYNVTNITISNFPKELNQTPQKEENISKQKTTEKIGKNVSKVEIISRGNELKPNIWLFVLGVISAIIVALFLLKNKISKFFKLKNQHLKYGKKKNSNNSRFNSIVRNIRGSSI